MSDSAVTASGISKPTVGSPTLAGIAELEADVLRVDSVELAPLWLTGLDSRFSWAEGNAEVVVLVVILFSPVDVPTTA